MHTKSFSSNNIIFPMVGITAYKPLSKDKVDCLVLQDDGSLRISQLKELGSKVLSNKKAYPGATPEFPQAFCITADVRLGSEAIRNGDSEGERNRAWHLRMALLKISVSNPNPDIVMVRMHVGMRCWYDIPFTVAELLGGLQCPA